MEEEKKDCSNKDDSRRTDERLMDAGNNVERNNNNGDVEDCVYTYRGDSNRLADLPSSFFQFYHHHPPTTTTTPTTHHHSDLPGPSTTTTLFNNGHTKIHNGSSRVVQQNNELYSPEMDFLEMDFDPGGTGEEDELDNDFNEETEPTRDAPEPPPPPPEEEVVPQKENAVLAIENKKEVSGGLVSIRLVKSNTLPEIGYNNNNKSLACPPPPPPAMVLSNSAPFIPTQNTDSKRSIELEVNGVMIWPEEEAKSTTRHTAILNALTALCISSEMCSLPSNVSLGKKEELDLPEYLFSQSEEHEDILKEMERLTQRQIVGRFFRPNPDISSTSLVKWLLHWICQGAVPVATLNLQQVMNVVSDISWQTQMIYGVDQEGVYLTNPVEKVPHSVILPQLTSPSVLLVRRQEVVLRKGPRTDLRKLARHPDPTWNHMNVLGQVSNMLLEEMPIYNNGSTSVVKHSTHISIPSSYKAGITLFVRSNDTQLCHLLLNAPQLC